MKKNKLKKKLYLYVTLFLIVIAIVSPKTFDKIANFTNSIEENKVVSISNTNETEKNINSVQEINIEKDKLNILYLDVGQADSQIIYYKDKIMVIDTGNLNDGEKIIEFLKSKDISKIDYLVGTHIGSMQYFINEFDILNIYLPYNETSANVYYKNLLNEVLKKQIQINEVEVGDKIIFEDLDCEILAVDNSEPEDENDASIVIGLKYKENSFLFTGDITKRVEKNREWNDVDVLKVAHHASDTSSSEDFLKQVKPEVSIISVGKNNNYNLPKENIIKRLEKNNSKVYRTDFDGTIQIVSDGKDYDLYKIDKSFEGNKE